MRKFNTVESQTHSGNGKEKKKIEKEKQENVWRRNIFNQLQRRRIENSWKRKIYFFCGGEEEGRRSTEKKKEKKWRREINGDIN